MGSSFSLKEIRFTQALQHRAFAWFWAGQTISGLGDRAFSTALAVVVYQLTGSSLAMGLFLTAQMVPQLIFTLFGGVAADRLPRRLVLLCADAGRGLIVFIIALLAWLHLLQLWHLFVLAVLFGCIASFFNPAYRAITPELVAKEYLASANALTTFSVQLGRLVGPVLGAGFIALSGGSASGTFAFDGLTFVISVCSLVSLRAVAVVALERTEVSTKETGLTAGLRSMLRDVLDGFRYILNSAWLLWSMIVAAFGLMAYAGAVTVSLPKMVFAVYHSGPWLLAAIISADGIGAIVGAILTGQVHVRRRGVVSLLGYIVSGLALVVFSFPLMREVVPFVILPAAFVVGFGISVMEVIWVTLLYELVPNEMLGRVTSVDLLGSLGLLPLGYVLAGWLGDRLGPPMVFLIGGLLMVVLSSVPLLLREIRELR